MSDAARSHKDAALAWIRAVTALVDPGAAQTWMAARASGIMTGETNGEDVHDAQSDA
jgi:hypothetical protein